MSMLICLRDGKKSYEVALFLPQSASQDEVRLVRETKPAQRERLGRAAGVSSP